MLSGLLDSAWGRLSRSTIVRFFVRGNNVAIGVGEGSIWQWEIDALKSSPIQHEWFKIEQLDTVFVPGIKYVPGRRVSGMPRELMPVKSCDVQIFVSRVEKAIFTAYRCFDINLGKGRILSIISPRTTVRDIVETSHSSFPKEKYRGKINNVEIDLGAINSLLEKGYGIGVLRKVRSLKVKKPIEGFPLLGDSDLKLLLKQSDSK